MKLNRNDYTVEAAAGGGFYAYFMNIWSRNLSDIPASYADRIILFTYSFHKFS